MVHIECGKCGYSCGTEAAWERQTEQRCQQRGCWQLDIEETMTPDERVASKFQLQW